MSFLSKGRKSDLIELALEFDEIVPSDATYVAIRDIIIRNQFYEEVFARGCLERIIEDRIEKEQRLERERIEKEQRLDRDKEMQYRDKEMQYRDKEMQYRDKEMQFELEKLRLEKLIIENNRRKQRKIQEYYEKRFQPQQEKFESELKERDEKFTEIQKENEKLPEAIGLQDTSIEEKAMKIVDERQLQSQQEKFDSEPKNKEQKLSSIQERNEKLTQAIREQNVVNRGKEEALLAPAMLPNDKEKVQREVQRKIQTGNKENRKRRQQRCQEAFTHLEGKKLTELQKTDKLHLKDLSREDIFIGEKRGSEFKEASEDVGSNLPNQLEKLGDQKDVLNDEKEKADQNKLRKLEEVLLQEMVENRPLLKVLHLKERSKIPQDKGNRKTRVIELPRRDVHGYQGNAIQFTAGEIYAAGIAYPQTPFDPGGCEYSQPKKKSAFPYNEEKRCSGAQSPPDQGKEIWFMTTAVERVAERRMQ